MKYYLLIYRNDSQPPQLTPEQQQSLFQSWQDYTTEAKEAGVYLSSDGLRPVSNATTVRVRNGKTLITDGPFAETHEQLAGYFLLNLKNLDEAIAWAAKLPGIDTDTVEIRPNWEQA